MGYKAFILLAGLVLATEGAPLKRQKRNINPLWAIPAAVGKYYLIKALFTGDGSLPEVNLGAKGNVGVGPVRVGGKIGVGAGGENHEAWYEPLPTDRDVVLQGQGGFSLGSTDFYGGAGVGADYNRIRNRNPNVIAINTQGIQGINQGIQGIQGINQGIQGINRPNVIAVSPQAQRDTWIEPLPTTDGAFDVNTNGDSGEVISVGNYETVSEGQIPYAVRIPQRQVSQNTFKPLAKDPLISFSSGASLGHNVGAQAGFGAW